MDSFQVWFEYIRMPHQSHVAVEYPKHHCCHSYDILGAGMLWKPKEAQKFVKIRENLLKFIKIRIEECFDKVLNEEF
jgi:hypothetical protein